MSLIRRKHLLALGIDPRRLNRLRWVRKLRVLRTYRAALSENLGYVLWAPEVDNFTYGLANEDELTTWLADTFSADRGLVAELLIEARSNPALHALLREATKGKRSMKTEPPLGRRLGWYVIARLLKPQRIIETGIHDGIGSLVLLAALERNAVEGQRGDLVSFDVDESAGWMVGQHENWSRRIEDTRSGLAAAFEEKPVQMFLHDSLHTPEHERFELRTAAEHMSDGAILSDNSHASDVLAEVCAEVDRHYAFFRERPRRHFYPGGGIGVGVTPHA